MGQTVSIFVVCAGAFALAGCMGNDWERAGVGGAAGGVAAMAMGTSVATGVVAGAAAGALADDAERLLRRR